MTDVNSDSTKSTDETAIRAVFDQLVASWNCGDGAVYGSLFAEDADYIDVTGTHTRGRAAIARSHQFLFDGPLKGSKLDGGADLDVQFLAPDVAIVIGGGTSQLVGQTEAPADRKSINTTVLIRRDGEWRIRAFQNNRIQPHPFGPPTQR